MKKTSRSTFDKRLATMAETIRAKITTNEYTPEAYIPSILQLSEEYNLSVNSVQKGLDILLKEGLIEKIPRKGIKVIQQHQITLSVGYYTTLLDELDFSQVIKMFEAKYPTIKVNLIPLNFVDYVESTEAYLISNLVDVIAINHFNFLQFSEKHEDLSQILTPLKSHDHVYSQLNHAFQIDDKLFVQPIVFSPVMLCYNKDYLSKLNIADLPKSWTWEQFIYIIDQLEANTNAKESFYFYPGTWNRWPIFLLQSGYNFSEENKNLSTEPIINAVDACYKLIHRQNTFALLLSTREQSIEELFLEQAVPIMVTTYYRLNHLKSATFEFDITALPYVNEPNSLLLPIGFAVNQKSEKHDLAHLFIDFLSSPEIQHHIRTHTYSIPAAKYAAESRSDTKLKQPSGYTMFAEQFDNMKLLSDLHISLKQLNQLYNIINLYWSGVINKQSLIQKLEEFSK